MVITFFEAVGKRYTFECNVLAADYDTMRVDIDAIIKSLRFQKS